MALSDELLPSKIQARRLADGSDCQLDARYPSFVSARPASTAWAESGENFASPSLQGEGSVDGACFLMPMLWLDATGYDTNHHQVPQHYTRCTVTHLFLSGIGGDLPPTFSSKSKLHLQRPGRRGQTDTTTQPTAVTSIAFWKLSPVPPSRPQSAQVASDAGVPARDHAEFRLGLNLGRSGTEFLPKTPTTGYWW